MKRVAFAVLLVVIGVVALVACAEQPRIELTEGQAAVIHDCFDNGFLARVTFNEHEQAEVICVAAY